MTPAITSRKPLPSGHAAPRTGRARIGAACLRAGIGVMAAAIGGAAIAQTAVPATGDANAATVPSPAAIIAAMPKNLPRAKGPGLLQAVKAAEAAEQACSAKGAKVSVLVADSVGQPVVLLSGDGAGVRSQLIAHTKVAIVARYKLASGEVKDRARADPALTAAAAADPDIGMLREGGFPVMRDGAMIGIVGVSGGSLGGAVGLDEACARIAVATLEAR